MRDAGDHDHQGHDMPQDWAGAFAALPQEAPATGGWQRLQARLPDVTPFNASNTSTTSRGRMGWPLWLATAASLALAVAIPLRMQSGSTPEPLATTPATDHSAMQPAAVADVVAGPDPVATTPIPQPSVEDSRATATMPANTARVTKPRQGNHVKPSQRPIRTVAQPADATRLATSSAQPPAVASAPGTSSLEPPSLEPLYAQSAQLEGLLAMARDDHVSNGTAAALTDTLDARVAKIDAALTRNDVTPEHRDDLWRDRIDTLRQLVGIETTQRLYSARGQQYDAALVSID